MAIDFRLTLHQRTLQLESRKFAADVLESATAAESLPTPEERFRATRPVYEAPWWRQDFCGNAFQFRQAATMLA